MKKSYPIHIRFNDIDAIGHVNNAIYISYFEEARISFFNDLLDSKWDWSSEGTLLAHNEIDYKAPVYFDDKAQIEIWVSHIGTKSLEVTYRIVKTNDCKEIECTVGKSVMVCYDYKKKKSIEVPEAWLTALKRES